MDLNYKIKQILVDKNLSPSQFADDIGVQRSSISHILAGRNRPSLDIIKKIVSTYADVEIEWLLDIEPHTNHQEEATNTSTLANTIEPIKSAYTTHEIPSKGNNNRVEHTRGNNTCYEPITVQPNRETEIMTGPQESIPANINSAHLPLSSEPTTTEAPLQVERILVFYTNGTFKEYKPS